VEDGVVDYEEAVVDVVGLDKADRSILGVVLFEVKLKLLRKAAGADFGGDSVGALGEHQQDGFVDIIVDQDKAGACGADQVGGKDIGIEDLAVVEDTFYGKPL
jgi:hypothetical protein